jgi:glycine betaine/proline transport system permease protein
VSSSGSRLRLSSAQRMVAGAGAFIVLTAIITFIWGSGMEFPVDVGRDLASWVNDRIDEITRNGAFIFDTVSDVVLKFLIWLEDLLLWLPWPSAIAGVGFVAWRTVGLRVAVFAVFALLSTGAVGLWPSAMETAALIIVSVIISIAIAVPIGILAARSDTVDSITRPILDGMQTMPPFVYLVPAIMFFGIGNVPAIFATVIYAVPPAIRLTNLGIRQVSSDVVEAARSFGTTPGQLLVKVQIPMAVPTIMAGINQTTMMALGMVVVASLVGAGGLGEDVLRALSRFQPGEALLAGLAIVGLAIITDRLTQAAAKGRQAALHGPGR